MNNKIVRKEAEFAGRKLVFETGNLAPQTNMSVLATYGGTSVLATVVSADANPEVDYFPLNVNYFEKLFASGTINSSRFVKRDGRPTDEAVVTRRLVDHAIRPLFPEDKGFMDEVQIALNVLSLDEESDPVFLSMVAASAALYASDVPSIGPMGTARVGFVDGKYVLNPSMELLENNSDLDMVVSFVGDDKRFLALECEANIIPEEMLLGAISFARDNMDPLLNLIKEFGEEVNPGNKKYEYVSLLPGKDLMDEVSKLTKEKVADLIDAGLTKDVLVEKKAELLKELYATFEGKYKKVDIEKAFVKIEKEAVRHLILERGKRPDGRGADDLRPLSGSVSVLPRVHGSAVFQRGLTQILNVATLGSPSMEQLIQDMYGERTKRFMHFYTFPPFSNGEVGRMGMPGGREIGHGMLAEKALRPVIPDQKTFPYTIILNSETLSSNGSTSMASTCACTLTLMDAGVPIKDMVGGISIGIVMTEDFGKYKLLTDLTGLEDATGFMDFKMTGTRDGVTAIQVDIKAKGIPFNIVPEIFKQSHDARMKILDFMKTVIDKPRASVSEFAPKTNSIKINPEQIGMVIGTGGKIIKGIQEDTQTTISIDEDGTVVVSGVDEAQVKKASEIIAGMTREVKSGEIFEGTIEELAPYGAFVEILPGKTGLLHISEITDGFVEKVEDFYSVGDKVKVKVVEVSRDGKYALSVKALTSTGDDRKREPRESRDSKDSRGGRDGRDSRNGGRRSGGFSRNNKRDSFRR